MTKKVIQINTNPVYEFGMVNTLLGENTELSGELTFKKSVQINGKFEGEIISTGYLIIGESGVVKANIKAKTVVIKGRVEGNIEAEKSIEIETDGKLFGNIKTNKLKIADGVIFEGKCEMTSEKKIEKKKTDKESA
jgi:cytoskeletal protein CcmA (bactofilin family)